MDDRKRSKNITKSKKISGVIFKIVAITLLCAFVIGTSVCSSFAQFSVNEAKDKRTQLQRQNEKLREISEKLGDEISEKEKKKAVLDEQVSNLMQQMEYTTSKISSLDKEILSLQEEIESREKKIESEMNLLKEKISLIYQTGGEISTLQLLLNCESLKDLISTLQIVEVMNASTYNFIDYMEKETAELNEKISEFNKKRDAVLEERKILEEKKADIKKLCCEIDAIIEELSKNKADAEREVSLNDEEVRKLDCQEAEYYRKQREAAELAAQNKHADGSETARCKASASLAPSGGGYCFPAPECLVVTSRFNEVDSIRGGRSHLGVDLACYGCAEGKPIVAAQSGVISFVNSSGWGGGYGKYVVIDHGEYKSTLYAHMSAVAVSEGQNVSKGQLIGYIGNTGHSLGAHLHFETRKFNVATGEVERYDPLSELSGYNYYFCE